jgi:hypothetical protein
MFGPAGEVVEIKMPKVATSFAELQELLRAGLDRSRGRTPVGAAPAAARRAAR